MDPYSRRFTWNVIQSNKANRIIVLTTHFLEEADILCDRIAIMGSGQVRCVGSSMYLKGLYGVGYNLTCVKGPGCDSHALEAIVAKHLSNLPATASPAAANSATGAQGYHVLSNVGSEMSFQIPFSASSYFPALFKELEQHIVTTDEIEALVAAAAAASSNGSEALTVKSHGSGIVRLATYGVSVTTLEEVFIRVAEEGHYENKKAAPTAPTGDVFSPVSTVAAEAAAADTGKHAAAVAASRPSSSAIANASGRNLLSNTIEEIDDKKKLTSDDVLEADSYTRDKAATITGDGKGLFMRHFTALFCKRWRYALRDRRAMCFQLLIPVAALLVGLALLHQVTTETWPELPLNMNVYNKGLTPSAIAAASSSGGPQPMWAAQGNPPNFVPVAIDDKVHPDDAATLIAAILTSGVGPTVPPPIPSPSVTPAPNSGGNNNPSPAPTPDTSLFATASGATFFTVPMSYLASQYNYSDYKSFAGESAYKACDYPDPNMAFTLINKDALALLAYPYFSLNETWMMSRFLLDSKNGSAPWLTTVSTSVAADGGVSVSTASEPARRLRSAPAAANSVATVSAAASTPGIINQYGASRYGAVMINEAKTVTQGTKQIPTYASYTALINTTGLFAAPTFVSMVHSGIYNWYATAMSADPTVSANVTISVTNAPLPFTKLQGTIINSLLSFIAVLFIVIAFSFIPASFAVFIVKETEVKAKHQQLISGVSIPAYWLATYTWDAINYALPCIMAIILVIAFDVSELVGESLSATVLLFIFYGLSVAPFTYIISYAFKSHSTAQIMTLVINLLCVILLLASFVMQQVKATCPADTYLRFFYRLLPGYALGNGLIQLSLLKELPFLESNCGTLSILDRIERTYTPFSLEAAGYPLLYMVLESVIYFLIAVGIDVLLSYPVIRSRLIPDKDIVEQPYEEDSDVEAEAQRVASGRADGDTIILKHLRKVYKGGKLAVKDLSFGIPRGEVFGFLGINCAGKTTTLKMLSGDEIPTRGTATLGGFDILTQQIEVRRLLGYTPQFDAHLDLLTTREHLEMYARIKGVPESMLNGVVNAKLREMDLVQYANKLAGSLSGGNKRKLSVAVAMVGDPPLMFLDEPSTGVDPVARRFLWRTIARVATERKQTSIILTTHSMEECEALSRRVGIMVGGRLRCLGSTQHLKDKFGRGFLALIKVSHPSEERISAVMRYMEPYFLYSPAGVAMIPGTSIRELCASLGDPTRARMLHPNGTGWALAAVLTRESAVDARQFAEWWASESLGAELNAFILRVFPGSTLSERHGEFFSYRIEITNVDHAVLNAVLAGASSSTSVVATGDLLGLGGASSSPSSPAPPVGGQHSPIRLSALFSVFEAAKTKLSISEYSLSQTSLEQIFNSMASQQEEEAGPLRGVAGNNSSNSSSSKPNVAAASAAEGAGSAVYSPLSGGPSGAVNSMPVAERKQSFAARVFTSLGNVAAASTRDVYGGVGSGGSSSAPVTQSKRQSVGGVEMRPSDASAITAYSHFLDGPQ
jgi:ABC-type multidrug transport system ATPase subunit